MKRVIYPIFILKNTTFTKKYHTVIQLKCLIKHGTRNGIKNGTRNGIDPINIKKDTDLRVNGNTNGNTTGNINGLTEHNTEMRYVGALKMYLHKN